MKRLFAGVVIITICFSISACSHKADIAGEYIDMSFGNPNSIYSQMISDIENTDSAKEIITIEKAGEEYTFQDNVFKGSCSVNDDKSLSLHRKEIITDFPGMKTVAELMLKQSPDEKCFLYKDYLVKDIALNIENLDGALPDGKPTYCSFSISDTAFSNFTLGLFEDGSCEVEGIFSRDTWFFEGVYDVNDRVVSLTFTEGDLGDQRLEGGCVEMLLYICDGEVYGTVYKKNN